MMGPEVRVERAVDLSADKVFPPVDAVRVGILPQVVVRSLRPLNADGKQSAIMDKP